MPRAGDVPAPRIAVTCQGGPRQLGLQQGSDLAEEISAGLKTLARLEAFRIRQPRRLPYGLFRWLSGRQASRHLLPALRQHDPASFERLEGLAEGAGLGLNALALMNSLEPLLSSTADSTAVSPPLGGCSAVAVTGDRSAGGEPVIARNFDYLPLIQPFYTVRDSRPFGRNRSLEFTVAPLAGAIDGVNEHGLVITYNYAFATDTPQAAPPLSMLIAEALGTCRSVNEAAELLSSRPRWGAGMLMLADSGGDLASLELSHTRAGLRRPGPGEDLVFHSNQYSTDRLRQVEVADDAVYSDAAPTPLRGCSVLESSRRRDARFSDLLTASRPLDADDLALLLADHGETGKPDDGTLCMHGDYWTTTACLQWFPRSRRVRLSYSSACQADFVELTL